MKQKIIFFILLFLLTAVNTHAQTIRSVGEKSLSFEYIDTYNTNDSEAINFFGRPTKDIFYGFRITVPMDIFIDHCGSQLDDTYVYLVRESGPGFITLYENDDYVGETPRPCNHYRHAGLDIKNLAAGYYYVVSEGYSENGYITTRIKGTVVTSGGGDGNTQANAINAGSYSSSATINYNDTRNISIYTDNYPASPNGRKDVFYKFVLSGYMDITVSHAGSTVTDTHAYLLREGTNGQAWWYADNNDSWDTGASSNPKHAFIREYSVPPGTYYVVSEGVMDGNIQTTITGTPSGGANKGRIQSFPVDLGSKSASFTFTDTQNINNGDDVYSCPSWTDFYNDYNWFADFFYKFHLTTVMDLKISHKNDNYNSTPESCFHILDASGNCIAHTNEGVTNWGYTQSVLEVLDMPAGTYTLVIESWDGPLTTTIAGTVNNKAVPSTDRPYILTSTPTQATPNASTLHSTRKIQNVQYFDGLGRAIQTVQVRASGGVDDLVTYQEYDAFGRESNSWLPTTAAVGNNGAFVPLSTVQTLAQAQYSDPAPFSTPVYEDSPLGRVTEQYGPGQAWRTHSRSVKTGLFTNKTGVDTLNCVRFSVTENRTTTAMTLVRNGAYADKELAVTHTVDEDGKGTTFEFTDKMGRVVLSRQIVRSGSAKTMYDTYYVYDVFGNLMLVMPPKASDTYAAASTAANWAIESTPALQQLAYLYKYDGQNRCKAKKLPGCDWIYYIYDKAGRLIFSQDDEQRGRTEWSFTFPDALGRPCLSGICKHAYPALADNPINALITVKRDNATAAYKGYALTGATVTSPQVLSVNYYDDYNFLNKSAITEFNNTRFAFQSDADFNTSYLTTPKSLPTGTLTAKLDGTTTSSFLGAVTYYDIRGRAILTLADNHLGGMEKDYTTVNHIGWPQRTKQVHTYGSATTTELYTYAYDVVGRVTEVTHSLNGAPPQVLAYNEYDELGRIKTVNKGGRNTLPTTYDYNVRSWMTGISSPLFNQQLYYTDAYSGSKPSFSGNISAIKWAHTAANGATNGVSGSYAFTYDDLSRLTRAAYSGTGDYTTDYSYDKHGNIASLKRQGKTSTTNYGTLLNQTYTYTGNQVSTAVFNKNGAMTQDSPSGISAIQYNLLNLPRTVAQTGGTNTYLYTADGVKRQVSSTKSGVPTTDYAGNKVYEGGSLKMIMVDGGFYDNRVKKYYFYINDHLGNNRVVADASGNDQQRSDYYPFGMSFGDNKAPEHQPFLYNGKELDQTGLNWYDYGARMYNPQVPRWSTPDPMAESYYAWSPYNYTLNNPMRFVDPNGMWVEEDDWWTTDDPEKIAQTLQALQKNRKNDGIEQADREIMASDQNLIDAEALFAGGYDSRMMSMDQGFALLGTATAGMQLSSATFRLTNSKGVWDPRLYRNAWAGNQWVTPKSIANSGKAAGNYLWGITSAFDAYGVFNYYYNRIEEDYKGVHLINMVLVKDHF